MPAEQRSPNAAQLRAAIDTGRTGDKTPFPDPAASPLGTDDEAAGTPPTSARVAAAMRAEASRPTGHARSDEAAKRAPLPEPPASRHLLIAVAAGLWAAVLLAWLFT